MRALLAAALVGGTALLGAPAQAAPVAHHWVGTPTDVFRTGQYSGGEWVYTNGLRQARGANTDGLERTDYYAAVKPSPVDPTSISYDLYNAFTYDFFGAHRAAHNGDFQLPTDEASYPAGTGEVAEVRMAVEGSDLHVRMLWNSFPRPDAQLATLTFGTPTSTAKAWPHGASLTGSWDSALTLWGTGGSITSGGQDTAVTVTHGDHTTEATVPLALLPSGPWTVQGGSGLTDPADRTHYWAVPAGEASATAPGSGGPLTPTNVWGLLFAGDTPWSFDELSQSRQLTAGTDTSSQTVDPALLRARATRLAPQQHGDFSVLLHSQYGTADGLTKDRSGALGTPSITPPIPVPDLNVSYYYDGALQDYGMHVPQSYDGSAARPLVVYLHGYTGLPEEAFRNPTGLVDGIDKRGWLLATPLGRGDFYYRGGTPGDADVMEVIADVEKRYKVDRSRIYLMGHSMGGYGTNNVATHHPDVFAAVAPAEGTDSADLFANLRDTPWFEMTAEEDLDTMATNAKALYASLSGAGYDATLLDYRLKTHEYSSIYDTLPRLFAFFEAHRLQARPAVVSWTRPVGQDVPRLHERYDGAWWLHDVTPAAGVTRPTVTVESMALPHAAVAPAKAARTDAMVDEGGPSGRTGAELLQTVPSRTPAVLDGTLRLTATGATAASVRIADAGLLGRPQEVVQSTVDHPFALTLVGETRTLQESVDGRVTGLVRAGQPALLPAGTHRVVLAPVTARAGRGTTTGPGTGLPTTGGSLLLAGVGALLLGGALGLRRRRA